MLRLGQILVHKGARTWGLETSNIRRFHLVQKRPDETPAPENLSIDGQIAPANFNINLTASYVLLNTGEWSVSHN